MIHLYWKKVLVRKKLEKNMNGIYNDDRPGSIKWRENSDNITKTMSLLSDKAKETIIKYYEKYG